MSETNNQDCHPNFFYCLLLYSLLDLRCAYFLKTSEKEKATGFTKIGPQLSGR